MDVRGTHATGLPQWTAGVASAVVHDGVWYVGALGLFGCAAVLCGVCLVRSARYGSEHMRRSCEPYCHVERPWERRSLLSV